MGRKTHVGIAVGLFLVLQIIAPILPGVDFLPKEYTMTYEVTSERLERQSTSIVPANAHAPFIGYHVLESEEIPKGTDVWGNVTSYYPINVQPSNWRVYLLTHGEYENADYESVNRRSIFVRLDPNRCCANSTDNSHGYGVSFKFRSNETTAYAFMYDAPYATRLVVDLFKGALVEQWWKQYVVFAEWILGVVIAVLVILLAFKRDDSV